MDLPDFKSPEGKPGEPPGLPSPARLQTGPAVVQAGPLPWRRYAGQVAALAAVIALTFAAIDVIRHGGPRQRRALGRWSQTVDPDATRSGRELLARRQTEKLNAHLGETRALVDKVRGRRGMERKVQDLDKGLQQAALLIQAGYFEMAEKHLEAVKAAVPPVEVENPLAAPPRLVDLPAPPKAVNPDPTPIAPASAQKPAPKKTKVVAPAKKSLRKRRRNR